MPDKIRAHCAKLEAIIFEMEESFMARFAPNWNAELIHLRFSSSGVEFVSLVPSGQHIINSVNWNDFMEWYSII